ncbi:tripartite tricarboxylate transporter substrate binding protein [Corticibacter populi]|uniref:Tripartite tricarboxylate transporter substrate binding protein n=1 Tax=Corticibacter populi TaxID=1550736 RepID=A0A3M6QMK2_9BURK|nr:tripartite tricarboxylate transporter substrate binding protein [Corticibacter populi]RMX04287.1 tripartite tricarboxylate transporter substrate binding protein [Corticibacter populi]RZS33334.1 tripartite-type tricarboxylate transporter receptor subunit TctC [Corticibacter populi]
MTNRINRTRRHLALAAALAFGLTGLTGLTVGAAHAAGAADWPAKPIRLIVPYAPGGFTDQMARLLQPGLQQRLGQPVVVDNKPGGNSIIGVGELARAAADGYTFGVVIAAYAANTSLYKKLPYDPARDIMGVSLLGVSPLLAAVSRDAPFQSAAELVEYARTHPGTISYGSSGNGSSAHLTSELLKWRTGIDMVHAPYRGAAPALADLMGGHIQVLLDAPTNLIEQGGRQGRVRLIGVAGEQRLPAVPDVPTFAEQGIDGVSGSTWAALIAPAGVPDEIVQRLSQAAAEIIRSEATRATLHDMGTFPEGRSPAETDAFIAAETAKWAEVIRQAGITLE